MQGTVFVFVKPPIAGLAKTRLGHEIGMGRAAALFRIMMERTIAESMKGPWRTVLAVEPKYVARDWARVWPNSLSRASQGCGDLGARMGRIFARAPTGPTVIIGSDAPGFRARHLREAFAALRGADAVFGPAEDGGYWLIGLSGRRAAPDLFQDVRWSTSHTLADTQACLPESFEIAELETLRDIDDAGDLDALGARATAR